MYLKVGCSFAANNVEFDRKKAIAVEHVKHVLYSGVEERVREVMLSTQSSEALKILHELLEEIRT